MRRLWIQSIGFIGLIVSTCGVPAAAQQTADDKSTTQRERVQRLLQIVAAGKDFHGDASDLVPELTKIIERGDNPAADMAIRALGAMTSKAAPAVPVLCDKLDDRSQATRASAVDALVAIGADSVEPLRKLIHSPSGKSRAAAATALGRLHRIDLDDLDELAKDPDPRVRAAVAVALAQSGEPGVARLAAMLTDDELAVAVEAARGLQANRADPSVAVPKLIESLSRPDLGWAAANALAAYGIEARRAVPAILKSYPLGTADRLGWHDAAEQTLDHIGPPDERDVEAVSALLTDDNEEVQILAAASLSLMGMAGRSAAPALESAAEVTIERYLELQREFESKPDDLRDKSGRVFVAVESLVAAVWHVTHDADRFLKLLEQTVTAAGSPIHFSAPVPWTEFSADDCLLLERLLRSSDASVQYTALEGVRAIGAKAGPLKQVLFELADEKDLDIPRQAIAALAAIGPSVAEEAAPVLFARLADGTIRLSDFAAAIGAMNIRSADSEAVLERGLQDADRSTVKACAAALSKTSSNPEQTVAKIIESARSGPLTQWDAIDVLQRETAAAGIVVLYLIEQMSSKDVSARRLAIEAVGNFGPAGAPAIDALKAQLDDKSVEIRLQAAKSIFQISGNVAPLDRQLRSLFNGQDPQQRHSANETIEELGPAGAPFLHYVIAELHAPGPISPADMISVLNAVGSADATAALEQLAKSTDWELRSRAIAALHALPQSDAPESK
jgi:HEAT repeat protein